MGPPRRNVDKRRQMFQDFKRLWKYSGHGVYKVNTHGVSSFGERSQITHHLRINFGETFAKGKTFYSKPDREHFVAYLLHAASKGNTVRNADVSRVFVSKGINYNVDDKEIRRLGCTREELYELFRGLPTANKSVRLNDSRALVFANDKE